MFTSQRCLNGCTYLDTTSTRIYKCKICGHISVPFDIRVLEIKGNSLKQPEKVKLDFTKYAGIYNISEASKIVEKMKNEIYLAQKAEASQKV